MGAGDPRQQTPVIGILYPGELGSALGKALAEDSLPVVTTLQGRSPRTEHLCREAGLEVLPSLEDVAEAAEVVLALVPPAAALAVAEQYAARVPQSPAGRLYVDLNSVSPATVRRVGAVLEQAGVACVDGSLHGLAAHLRSRCILYLSGPPAHRVAGLLDRHLKVRVLGDRLGQASAMKMLLAGMSKGLIALFLELTLAARQADLLDEVLTCYRDFYPGVMTVIDRLLPTYPQHASRRSDELKEVEETLLSLGVRPGVTGGARQVIAEVGRLRLAGRPTPADPHPWSIREVVEAVHARHPLRPPPPAETAPALVLESPRS